MTQRTISHAVFLAAFVAASPAQMRAQSDAPSGRPAIGVYLGLIYEASSFDSKSARVLEGESGRIGLLVGRWSVGYVGKRISNSSGVVVIQPGQAPITSSLHVQGAEVGFLVPNRWPVRPSVHVTVGRGEVETRQRSGLSSVSLGRASTPVIEPAVGIGVSLLRVFRAEGRVGVRLGRDVRLESEEIATSGVVASVTVSLGWMGAW